MARWYAVCQHQVHHWLPELHLACTCSPSFAFMYMCPMCCREHGGGGPNEDPRDPSAADADNADEDDDDDDEAMGRWNLRKCSAEALDMLSNAFGDELLPLLLPIVKQRLEDVDWRARESAILALGAVAQGCHQGLLPLLPDMVSMLLPKLMDPRPMVRIISCWTLSRYAQWLYAGEGRRH